MIKFIIYKIFLIKRQENIKFRFLDLLKKIILFKKQLNYFFKELLKN